MTVVRRFYLRSIPGVDGDESLVFVENTNYSSQLPIDKSSLKTPINTVCQWQITLWPFVEKRVVGQIFKWVIFCQLLTEYTVASCWHISVCQNSKEGSYHGGVVGTSNQAGIVRDMNVRP